MHSHLSKKLGLIIFAVVVLGFSPTHFASAAAITAAQTGNWNQTSTWTGGVIPGNGDTANIPNGITVTVTASTSVGTSVHADYSYVSSFVVGGTIPGGSGTCTVTMGAATTIDGAGQQPTNCTFSSGVITVTPSFPLAWYTSGI